MKRLSLISIKIVFIIFLSSCVDEHQCEEPAPVNTIEDGFTSAVEPDFVSQLHPDTRSAIRIRNATDVLSIYEEGFVRFNDLTVIEGDVQNATLKLYIKDNPKLNIFFPNTYTIQVSALQEGWNENTLSHANRPAAVQKMTTQFPADILKPGDLYEIDVTEILNEQFANEQNHYGFGLSLVSENKMESMALSFYSSDNGNAALNPELDVIYEW